MGYWWPGREAGNPTKFYNKMDKPKPHLIQRIIPTDYQLRPQRWNWAALLHPLDRRLGRDIPEPLSRYQLVGLRYFWLDGLFTAVSENFYLNFIVLFALAYGANNGQIGLVTAAANLLGAISLFPGARLAERSGRRKQFIVWSAGGWARLALLGLALLPLFITTPEMAVILIVALNGLRAFMNNLGNPAWTAFVADLVPAFMRGRYFSSRNTVMGIASLLILPLAGLIIRNGNGWLGLPLFGYQFVFLMAFAAGMIATLCFWRIPEPPRLASPDPVSQRSPFRQTLSQHPNFWGLVIGGFIWNLALQVASPFFNVYLVSHLGANTAEVGFVSGVSALTALFGQQFFGRLLDKKGAWRVQSITGLLIPGLPVAWIFITQPWHVAIINTFGGFLWAGYNLANFNLLLELTPNQQRAQAVALYQTVVFASAVLGPLLGGYLADAINFKLIFGLSGVGRLLGMIILWALAYHNQRQN